MSAEQADRITGFMREHDLRQVLELGFKFGVSTCYIAGALQDMTGGHITTIDLERMRQPDLNVDILLDRCGLAEYATCSTSQRRTPGV
jgi:predicted O-methyltransferase YrrM